MKRTTLAFAILISSPVLACGGGGGAGGPRESAAPQPEGVLGTRDLGRVDADRFRAAMHAVVVGRYGHTLSRQEEQLRTVTYEFEWKSRDPTPEGRSAGYTDTRYRITIQGRRGAAGRGGTSTPFRFSLRSEYQARTTTDGAWRPTEPLDADLAAAVERMLADLEAELQTLHLLQAEAD